MNNNYIRCEMHCHTFKSACAGLKFKTIIRECKKKQIQAIAITDHNDITGALEFAELAPPELTVIIGEEIKSKHGEVIGLFIKENIQPNLSLRETMERIKMQGGLVNVPHPFDGLRKNAVDIDELEKNVDLIDMLEVFNSRICFNRANRLAIRFASRFGILPVCGSDAHFGIEIGKSILTIAPFTTATDFKKNLNSAVIQGTKSPVFVHLLSKYRKIISR